VTTDVEHLIWIKNRLISLSLDTQSNTNKTGYIERFNKIIEKLQTEQSEKTTVEIFAKAHGVETKPLSKIASDYESLSEVLDAAYKQASTGKGKERHADDKPFHEQPMQLISQMIGSAEGMRFQVMKKVNEAKGMTTFEQKERELLGAINYIAGIIIYEKNVKR
jgi:uncharacterized protein YutD